MNHAIFSISALNPKTVAALLLLGPAPLLLISGVLFWIAHGKTSLIPAVAAAGLAMLLTGLGLWQLSVVRLHVSADMLRVGGGLYRISVPMAEVQRTSAARRDPANPSQALGVRTNGIGMPGLALGWFRAKSGGGRVFAAVSDPAKVIVIPTTLGYTILVSPDDPESALRVLHPR